MDNKGIVILYLTILILCFIIIGYLIYGIDMKNDEIRDYQIKLNDKEWELYINQMAYDEYRELFYSCMYSDGMPNYEED